jgi:hypothetical protein
MTLTLAADGPVLITLDAARRQLAATSQWSTIANSSRIHLDALPPASPGPTYSRAQMIAARPFALLWCDPQSGYRIESGSQGPGCPNQSGMIICQIELNVPVEHTDNPENLALWANRLLGRLIRTGNSETPGLWDLSGSPGYLPIRSIDLHSYARTTKKEAAELGDAIIAELVIGWSTR